MPVVAAVIILVAGLGVWYSTDYKSYSQITSYDQCAAAGYPILETYPEQCKLPDGRTFTRNIEGPGPVPSPTSSPTQTTTTVPRGTLSGYIHVGPTCAVQPVPPSPSCDDRPYENAAITITNKASGAASKAVTDAAGNFRVALAPGTYTIRVAPTSGRFPSCEVKDATVLSGKTLAVDIGCDSGLR
jgi:hypothetical protein